VYSQGYLHNLFGYGWRNRFPVCLKIFQIPSDSLLDVIDRFGTCIALRNTTRKRWDFDDKDAVLILLNEDSISHSKLPPTIVVVCDRNQFGPGYHGLPHRATVARISIGTRRYRYPDGRESHDRE
jgi:hypothetical protein